MCLTLKTNGILTEARLAQSAERKALNLVVVGSSPTVGVLTGCVTKRAYLRSTWPHWRKVDIIAGVSLKKLCVASQWYVAILQRPIYVTTLSSVCLKQHMRNGRRSCSCCGHISWQYSRTSCSVSEHTFSTRSLTMLRSFWACPRLFFVAIKICGLWLWPCSSTACQVSWQSYLRYPKVPCCLSIVLSTWNNGFGHCYRHPRPSSRRHK